MEEQKKYIEHAWRTWPSREYITGWGEGLGDAAWVTILNTFYTVARKELVRFRGHEILATGDGFLLNFDGPARAIRCALAVTENIRHPGIRILAEVHTGEGELMDDNVGGIAVHERSCSCWPARHGIKSLTMQNNVYKIMYLKFLFFQELQNSPD